MSGLSEMVNVAEGDWMNEVPTRNKDLPLQSPASAQCDQTQSRHS